MEKISYEEYRDACVLVKNYRIQEKQKYLANELENQKNNPDPNPTCEDLREIYSYRLYYQILEYFDKTPGYHRLQPNIRVADLNHASVSQFRKQKGFGKRLENQLERLCKKYKVILRE